MAYNACYSAVSFMALSSSESSGINFITESGVQCYILRSFSSDKRVMYLLLRSRSSARLSMPILSRSYWLISFSFMVSQSGLKSIIGNLPFYSTCM